jgi:uncharacterized membrane protein YccC
MAVVGFTILFSGVINGYFAAAATAAMLTFILAVTIPAPLSDAPARLEGWLIAAAVCISAQLLLWPQRRGTSLRAGAAGACRELAELADAVLAHDDEAVAERTRAAGEAVDALRSAFLSTPHRPTGPTRAEAALSSLVDELDWLFSLLAPPLEHPGLPVCRTEQADAVAASVAALRAAAALLEGDEAQPDFDRLAETRHALMHALVRQIPDLPTVPDDDTLVSTLQPVFRIRGFSFGARDVAVHALEIAGRERSVRSTIRAAEHLTADLASARSVWFRNSLRGAVGVAIAVYVAQRSGLQHAFWVVLGTLSVLRSNALGTGWSIVSALGGTAAGIVAGAALVLAIGTHHAVFWVVLPLAILLASYAPRAISFAAGQAGFTVVLFVLFNLIQPTGWRVGLVRIEDVAIGFAISLVVGILFWPRGAAALLRQNLAFAYARNADYVVAAERRLVDGASEDGAASAAAAAAHRLDDAFRQYLSERSTQPESRESITTLVAGAERVRRAAQSLSELAGNGARLERCAVNLDAEVQALRTWYVTLGDSLVHATSVPPPHTRDGDGRRRLLECVRETVATGDRATISPALELLWASQHLDVLWQLEGHLGRHAAGASANPVS